VFGDVHFGAEYDSLLVGEVFGVRFYNRHYFTLITPGTQVGNPQAICLYISHKIVFIANQVSSLSRSFKIVKV
jgi:hypothetical protein